MNPLMMLIAMLGYHFMQHQAKQQQVSQGGQQPQQAQGQGAPQQAPAAPAGPTQGQPQSPSAQGPKGAAQGFHGGMGPVLGGINSMRNMLGSLPNQQPEHQSPSNYFQGLQMGMGDGGNQVS